MNEAIDGNRMYEWAKKLFPINRSLTGDGVRETLRYIKQFVPELVAHEVPSNTIAFDWKVPQEWKVNNAYIIDPNGNKICDFKVNNLHLMGYSEPVNKTLSLKELQTHLYSIEDMPDAIPYVTSYYERNWGFCLSHSQRLSLTEGSYQVVIDTNLFNGHLTYGEFVLPGETENEILLSTYICHPSLANNELSGPVVCMALIEQLKLMTDRRYTYRVLFLPETIGSIVYISKHLKRLKQHLKAGFIVTCVGDEREYSYLSSRNSRTLADRAALSALKNLVGSFKQYSFLERGSDERQFCAPGVDLPVCSIMRSKYGEYPEYHTSLDNLTLITPAGLRGAADVIVGAIQLLEKNKVYKATNLCEPQLGKRGLYPNTSNMQQDYTQVKMLTNLLAYADGGSDLLELADKIRANVFELLPLVESLEKAGLIIAQD